MSSALKGKSVNRQGLAEMFGVTVVTVDAWVRAGCPYVQRSAGKGKPWVFDSAEVASWREQRASDAAGGDAAQDEAILRRRKLAAEARRAELEVARAMGEVADIAEMERAWARVFSELQSSLRGAFVTRCESQLLGETDPAKFKRVLLAEVDSSLETLANMDPEA